MADPAAMSVESNTPEKIALELMQMIAHIEKMALHSGPSQGWTSADRQWLLSTYAQCIEAVRSPEKVVGGGAPAAAPAPRARASSAKSG
jgi:hypothetical protein